MEAMGAALGNVKKGCGCDASDVKKAEQIAGQNGKTLADAKSMTDAETLDVLKKALKEVGLGSSEPEADALKDQKKEKDEKQ